MRDMMARMLAAVASTPVFSHDPGVSRRARVAAEAFDLLLLGIAVAIASVVAGAWLLLRTRGGAFDLGRGDAAIAMALWMSAVPAWWGLLVFDSVTGGQTPGIAQARLRVEGGTAARLLRLVLRPVATLAWLWVTFLAVIATGRSGMTTCAQARMSS